MGGMADHLNGFATQAGNITLESRVLIADTDAALRQQLYGELLNIDVFSDCAGNATDALAMLDESSYGLVIADVGLASNGIEQVISRIAAMDHASRPIVLVVAENAEGARSLDVEIVQIVLRRPVNVPQVVDLIASCVRSAKRTRREIDPEATLRQRADRAV